MFIYLGPVQINRKCQTSKRCEYVLLFICLLQFIGNFFISTCCLEIKFMFSKPHARSSNCLCPCENRLDIFAVLLALIDYVSLKTDSKIFQRYSSSILSCVPKLGIISITTFHTIFTSM